jgi:hypothetical protein
MAANGADVDVDLKRIDQASEVEETLFRARSLSADVTDAEQMRDVMGKVVAEFTSTAS